MKAALITLLKVYEAFLMGRLCWIYVVSPGIKAVKYIHALSCRLSQFVSTEKVSCMCPESRCKVSCTSFTWCPVPYTPTESKLNTGVGLLPLLLPVISSLPHPAIKPIIHAMIMKPINMYPKFLGGLVGFIPKIFLIVIAEIFMRAPQLMKLNVYQRYASKALGLSSSILSLCEIRYTFITKLTDLFSFVKCDKYYRLKIA